MSRQHKHPAEVCDQGCKVKPVIPVESLFPVALSRSGAGAAEAQSSAQEKWAGGGRGRSQPVAELSWEERGMKT